MQSFKKPKSKKSLFIIIGAAVLLVIAVVAYILINQKPKDSIVDNSPLRPANTVDYGPPTETEKQVSEQQKEDIIKQNEQEPEPDSSISASIIRADQLAAGQPLNIRVDISGAQGGTCEVSLTKAGQNTVFASFPVVFEATSSRCQAADVAASQFGESGEWTMTLVIKNGAKQSSPLTQTVTIQK